MINCDHCQKPCQNQYTIKIYAKPHKEKPTNYVYGSSSLFAGDNPNYLEMIDLCMECYAKLVGELKFLIFPEYKPATPSEAVDL